MNRDTTVVNSCMHAFLRALSGVYGSLKCVLLYAVVHRGYIHLCILFSVRGYRAVWRRAAHYRVNYIGVFTA